MSLRVLGAVLLLLGSGCFGMFLSAQYRREVLMLERLGELVEGISCELQYRLTPLPELLRSQSQNLDGPLRELLLELAAELEAQVAPDVGCCFHAALDKYPVFPPSVLQCLQELGRSLGKFDLKGQLLCLESVRSTCEARYQKMLAQQPGYLRCCRAYCICAGVVTVLLLL